MNKIFSKYLGLLIFPFILSCYSGHKYVVRTSKPVESGYFPVYKTENCKLTQQAKKVRIFFYLPLNNVPTPVFDEKNISVVYKNREIIYWDDIVFNILGFLFSVLTTSEEWEECTTNLKIQSSKPSLIDLPMLNLSNSGAKEYSNQLYFLNNKTTLEENSLKKAESIGENILKSEERFLILIIGHTSSSGNFQYNLELSWKRAEKIKSILVNKGIDESRIVLSASGNSWRLLGIKPELSDQEDRRVNIILIQD